MIRKAKEKKAEEEKKAKETREEYGRIAKIGAERLRPLVPTDAKAVIIGTLRVNECDSYTDYYDYSIARTVIWAGTSTAVGRLRKSLSTTLKNS